MSTPGLLLRAALGGALLAALFLDLTGLTAKLEMTTLDLRFNMRSRSHEPSPVSIVRLRAVREVRQELILREELARFLEALVALPPSRRPASVVVDIVLSLPESALAGAERTAGERIITSTRILGNVVHAFQLTLCKDGMFSDTSVPAALARHRLPYMAGATVQSPLESHPFSSILGPQGSFGAELFASAAGVGFVNVATDCSREPLVRSIPMLARYIPEAQANTVPTSLDSVPSFETSTFLTSLSFAGAAVAQCARAQGGVATSSSVPLRALGECLSRDDSGFHLGISPKEVVVRPDVFEGGNLHINYRKRFQLQTEPGWIDWLDPGDERLGGNEVEHLDTRGERTRLDSASSSLLPEVSQIDPTVSYTAPLEVVDFVKERDKGRHHFSQRLSAESRLEVQNNSTSPGIDHAQPDMESPRLRTLDGREVLLEALHGQAVLVVDSQEKTAIQNPLGNDFPQAAVHAQAMANLLEDDLLAKPTRSFAWISSALLVGAASMWRLRRERKQPHQVVRPPQAGTWFWRLRPSNLAPELILVAAWTSGGIGGIVWNLWLPLVLPITSLLSSLAARQMTLPLFLRSEIQALTTLGEHHRRLAETLHIRMNELITMRDKLGSVAPLPLAETPTQARSAKPNGSQDAETPTATATKHLSVQESEGGEPPVSWTLLEIEALDRLIGQAARALSIQLDEIPRSFVSGANLLHNGEFRAHIAMSRREFRVLLDQFRAGKAAFEKRTERAADLKFALSGRRETLSALLRSMVGLLETTTSELLTLARPERILKPATLVKPTPELEALMRSVGLVTKDNAMLEVLTEVLTYAQSNLPILILGESGTGKELVAAAIHHRSLRASRPFIAVNCSTLTSGVGDTELFGSEKGSYTGVGTRSGALLAASGGTLFLDELAELPLEIQKMLLRVLQEKEMVPRGGDYRKPVAIDVRIVAATNQNLDSLVKEGRFRADLLHRIRGTTLILPPLRQRLDDMEVLAQFHLEEGCREEGISSVPGFAPGTTDHLRTYLWPGNIRELRMVMRRLAIKVRGRLIEPEDVSSAMKDGSDLKYLGEVSAKPSQSSGVPIHQAFHTEEHSGFNPVSNLHESTIEAEASFVKYRESLERWRDLGFRTGPGKTDTRHQRILICAALGLEQWNVTRAIQLLCVKPSAADIHILSDRIHHLLEDFKKQQDARSLNEIDEALRGQYRSDWRTIRAVHEALRRGAIRLSAD